MFSKRISIEQIEESNDFAPKFDDRGLLPVVTTDYETGEVLMHAFMNADALKETITSGYAVYYSRSKQALWRKGAHSGLRQKIRQIRIDDDQDAVWLRVDVMGGASCHVGYRSCFYRSIQKGNTNAVDITLQFEEKEKVFDPEKVYEGMENPTKI